MQALQRMVLDVLQTKIEFYALNRKRGERPTLPWCDSATITRALLKSQYNERYKGNQSKLGQANSQADPKKRREKQVVIESRFTYLL